MKAIITASPSEFRNFVNIYRDAKNTRISVRSGKYIKMENGQEFVMISDTDDVYGRSFDDFEQLEKTPTNINEVRFALQTRLIHPAT